MLELKISVETPQELYTILEILNKSRAADYPKVTVNDNPVTVDVKPKDVKVTEPKKEVESVSAEKLRSIAQAYATAHPKVGVVNMKAFLNDAGVESVTDLSPEKKQEFVEKFRVD